ncbi:MAG: alcohol dehydrogenase catalytic domain-containing protein [Bacillota bacterium]|nr:alcohol dehydrogenase catalytic domain-containing protein [Bacillota bacterium]
MKTAYVEFRPASLVATRLLGRVFPSIYFSRVGLLHVADAPPPPLPAPNWVRLRNRACGICGSELHLVFGRGDLGIAPAALPGNLRQYLGHELVGEVVEVGSAVRALRPGDRVVQQKGRSCLSYGVADPCPSCREGNYSRCQREPELGPSQLGGGWSEQCVVPEGQLFPIPPDLSDHEAVLLEPAACGVRAALRCPPRPGERVLIFGAGTMGFFTLQAARAAQPSCYTVVIVQFPFQEDMARRLGADEVWRTTDDIYERTARLTGARLHRGPLGNRMLLGGFDVVYDCVGKSSTLGRALRLTRAGGTVVLVGVELHPLTVDLTPVWHQEVNLAGTVAHGQEDFEGQSISTYDLTLRWWREGKLTFDGFVTHRFPLDRLREALMAAADKKGSHSVKVVLEIG